MTERKLTDGSVGGDGNQRTYIDLPDGRKLPLPYPWRNEEFTLDGNLELHHDGQIVALYDETTRTGAYYCGAAVTPYWVIWQPCLRAHFFEEMVPGWVAEARRLNGASTIAL